MDHKESRAAQSIYSLGLSGHEVKLVQTEMPLCCTHQLNLKKKKSRVPQLFELGSVLEWR